MSSDPAVLILLYGIMPLWLAAGFADWLCHRASNIQETTGAKESAIHLLMFVQVGIPILIALFFEINALIIIIMMVGFVLHEATAMWDLSYAATAREVTPIEQHVHDYLVVIPFAAILIIITRHWDQFISVFGSGTPEFALKLKSEPLPVGYIITLLSAIVLLELLPYVEELFRGLRANNGRWVPAPARKLRSHSDD